MDSQAEKSMAVQSDGNPVETTTKGLDEEIKKKKKTILREVPPSDVKYVMSYKPESAESFKVEMPEKVVCKMPGFVESFCADMAVLAEMAERCDPIMLEKQKNYRQQLKTYGKVFYEVEVDDDYKEEGAPLQDQPGGRRRHRPGVIKTQAGQTKKLN